jgi:HSP20 family protein
MLLERMDPFLADFDRIAQHALGGSGVSLPMDVVRRGDEVICHFDLPGADPDAIEVTLDGDALLVRAGRTITYGEGDQLLVAERASGQVTRRVRLGDWAAPEKVQANYTDGVLTVTIPVAERAKPRKIDITRSVGAGERPTLQASTS